MLVGRIKKILLVGTALFGTVVFPLQAQALPRVLTQNDTWADTGVPNAASADVTEAVTDDNVDVNTWLLRITTDANNDDGGGTGLFDLGAITDTDAGAAGTGGLLVTSTNGFGDVTVTADSFDVAGDVDITGVDADNVTLIFVTEGNAAVGGNLTLFSDEADVDDAIGVTVGGTLDVTGTTDITAGDFGLTLTQLTVDDNATFTGLVTVSGGTAGLGSTAFLVLKGETNTFTNGIILDNAPGDSAGLLLAGLGTQTVNGTINQGAPGMGFVSIINMSAGGVTFNDTITVSRIRVGSDTFDTLATFNTDVSTSVGLTVGDGVPAGVADIGTVIFNTAGGDIDVSGAVRGAVMDTAIVNISGGNEVTANALWGDPEVIENVNVTGVAGTSLNAGGGLNATTVTVAAGNALTLGADSVITNTNLTGAGTVTVADNADLTGAISGTGGAVGAGVGNVVFNGTSGTLTTIGAGGILDSLMIGAAGSAGETVTTTGNVAAADTNSINGNTLDAGGDFILDAGQTLNVDLTGLLTSGQVISTGNATVNANSFINVTVDPDIGYLIPGAYTRTLIDGAPGGGLVSDVVPANITGGTAILTIIGQDIAQDDDFEIVTDVAAISEVSTTENGDTVGAVLNTIGLRGGVPAPTDGGIDIDTLLARLMVVPTVAVLNERLEALIPTTDGSAVKAFTDVGDMTRGIADARMTALHEGDNSMTGIAAGSSANGNSVWLQGFGQVVSQDARGSMDGYDSDIWGISVGADATEVFGNFIVGIMFNYANTNADSDNINATITDVDSYGVNLFTSIDVGETAFINAQGGYTYNSIDTLRHDTDAVPGSGNNSAADYSSNQASARLAFGRDYPAHYGLTLTPSLSTAYTRLNIEGYTETGTGANLTVDEAFMDVINVGFDMKAVWRLRNTSGSRMQPALHAGYAYDVIGDRIETTSSFTGDPAATTFVTTGGDPQRSRFDTGAGLTYMDVANWDLSAKYNYTVRENYGAHSGTMRMTSHF